MTYYGKERLKRGVIREGRCDPRGKGASLWKGRSMREDAIHRGGYDLRHRERRDPEAQEGRYDLRRKARPARHVKEGTTQKEGEEGTIDGGVYERCRKARPRNREEGTTQM